MSEGLRPEALIVRTEQSVYGTGCVVTLAEAGIGWECRGIEGAHWVPWDLLGGISERGGSGRGGWATDALALDGSSLGTIFGLVAVDGVTTTLAHVVATFRPDLFVEMDDGCIRREVVASDGSGDGPTRA
jgi:hypothetical protein